MPKQFDKLTRHLRCLTIARNHRPGMIETKDGMKALRLLTSLWFGVCSVSWAAAAASRAPLQQSAYDTLPLGAVHPLGWLRTQEQIQASGLTGHLDEFWNDVGANSGWLGGSGESWE